MAGAVSANHGEFNMRRTRAHLSLAAKGFLLLSLLLMNYCVSAAEAPTDEVLQLCRAQLSSERGAKLVDHWSTKPLPSDFRRAAAFPLKYGNASGWTAYKNPNQTWTIVILLIDPETQERNFVILIKDSNGLIFKEDVFAFEFARSSSEHDGVIGLFFCGKQGPSAEWVWNGTDWKVAH